MARTPRKSSYSESEEDEPEEPTGKKAPDNDISAPVTNTSLLFSSDEEEADADQDEPKINGVGSKTVTNSKPVENVEEDEDGDEPAGAVAKRTRSGSSPAKNDVKTSESDSINSDSRGGGLKRKRKSPAGMKSYIQKLKEAHGVASDEEEAEVQESADEPEEEAEAEPEEYSSDDNTPKSAPKKINNLGKSNGSAEEGPKPRPRSPVKNNLSPAFKNARTPQQEEDEDDAEEPEEPEDEDHDVTVPSSHIMDDDSSPEPDLSVDRLKELLMKAKYLWISQEPTVFIERLDLESLTLNQDGSYDVSEFCSPYKKNVTISDDPPSQLMFTPSPSSSASAVI